MWIQVFGLCCLISVLTAQKPTTTPKHNPECNGMTTAAKHLKTGINFVLKEDSNCQVNPHCTGVKCSWSNGGYLEVDLHNCHKPINYHVLFNAPGKHVFKNLTLQKGDEKVLYDGKVTVNLKVAELKLEGNVVTTTVQLITCTKLPKLCLPPTSLLDQQQFCVRMQNCPGYNASAVHYKPCGFKPTGRFTTQSTSLGSSSTDRSSTQSSFLGSSSTGHTSGHVQSHPARSTSTDPSATSGSFDAHKGHHKDSSLSTGAIIGICAAAIVVILIVVGVVVYWKKYHHRSRLRAAYYNDISMHDPLYEDFGGPEVA